MMHKLLIKNGTIYTHDKIIFNQDILIVENKIELMAPNIEEENAEIIDAEGLYIVPGLIVLHCNLMDPGYDFRETITTAGASAMAGGFTTITCNPNTLPVIDNKAMVEYIIAKTKSETPVHVVPYGSLTVGCEGKEIAEIGSMQLAGIAAVSDGDIAIQDDNLLMNLLKYCNMFDLPIVLHSENTSISNDHIINDGTISTYLGIMGSPVSAETTHIMRNLLLAEEFDAQVHLSHVSTAKSVELIQHYKKQGLKITCETSPQYFTLNEEAAMGYNTFVKVNPPLRTEEDVKAIIKGIQDGTIDAISSDHNPNTIDSKEVEFSLASYGISSFETAFSLSYTYLVEPGYITLEQLIEKMSYKPSRILTLNKGVIHEGAIADLMIFDPNEDFLVDASQFESKARYSPYDGLTLTGKVKYTIVDGKRFTENI